LERGFISTNNNRQAAIAARTMLGQDAVYNDPHWFWSDQFGCNIQGVGQYSGPSVIRGDLESDAWTAFFITDSRLIGAFGMNTGEDISLARELVSMQVTVDGAKLADTDVDLFELLDEGFDAA
jgi:3-phenylpropionate/trans-cinnamate dioxygenase ferredoxin reductase subunit